MSDRRYSMLVRPGTWNEDETGTRRRSMDPASGEGELRNTTDADTTDTTDAMQRAADAMIAATESFRRQLHEQDEPTRPPQRLYRPYRPDDIIGFNPNSFEPDHPPTTPSLPSTSNSKSSQRSLAIQEVSPSSSHRRHIHAPITSPTIALATTAAITPVPAAAVLYEFLPQRPSVLPPMPPVNTTLGGPSSSTGYGDMVDVDLSPMSNNTNRTGATSMTNWPETESTPVNMVQSLSPVRPYNPKQMSPTSAPDSSRHIDLVTAAENYRSGLMSHPNPLNSHPASLSPGFSPSSDYSPSSAPGSYPSGHNYSTASVASMHQNIGGLSHLPQDSVDEFNTPLFPQPTHGRPGHGDYVRFAAQGGPGGIKRNALSRSLKRAAAYMPRLSPPLLANQEPVTNEKNTGNNGPPDQPGRPRPENGPILGKIQKMLFVLVICLADGLMLAGLAQGIAPMFDIIADFPTAESGEMMWYTAAYALTAGVFVLPGARLGGVFGPKRVFVLGFLWFAVWSLVAGFALAAQRAGGDGNVFFIFCRAMQGIGPGLVLPNGQVLVGKVFLVANDVAAEKKKRETERSGLGISATVLFGAAAPVGFVVGSVMSALFAANSSSWPWAFWTMAAVCLSTCGLALLALPSSSSLSCPEREERRRAVDGGGSYNDGLFTLLDVPGTALLVAGLVLFDVGWNEAPICGWQTPYTYFLVIVGVLVLVGFVYVERHAPYPLVPIARMGAKTAVVLAAILAGWMAWGVWVVYTFRFLEGERNLEALVAAAQISDFVILGLGGSLLLAFMLSRAQVVRPSTVLTAGLAAFIIPSILLATAPVEQTYWINVFLATLLVPLGMELSIPAATAMLEEAMPEGEKEGAAWLVMAAVNYGISLGLGVAGTVERSTGREGEAPLDGLRGGQWMGAGLAGLGFLVAVLLMVVDVRGMKKGARRGKGAVAVGV